MKINLVLDAIREFTKSVFNFVYSRLFVLTSVPSGALAVAYGVIIAE